MKIAIITLHRVYNYGSVLQTYATQEILHQFSDSIEVIDYVSPVRTFKNIYLNGPYRGKKLSIKKILYYLFKAPSILVKQYSFGHFIHKYLHLSQNKYINAEDLMKNPPRSDVYITGSDQTWNSKYNGGVDKGYFLDFAPQDKKRIAFCSSFGSSDIQEQDKREIQCCLMKYDSISVREKSAVDIIAALGIQTARFVIDPTLQLNSEFWSKICAPRRVKEKYLFLFLPYTEDNQAYEIARDVANRKGLRVVELAWNTKNRNKVDCLFLYRSPEVFLSLVKYSDVVITNSFHCVAFSINFNKCFLAVKRLEFNERIYSLLELTGLSDRQVKTVAEAMIADKEIDYKSVNSILNSEREKAASFLAESLKKEKEYEHISSTKR